MEFKVGMVIFFNWKNTFSKLIRLFNRVKYGETGWTHVGIITKIEGKSVQIHEALSKGFVKSWYPKKFLNEKIKYNIIEVKSVNKKLFDVEWNANNYLGRGYGWWDIFGIVLSFIFGIKSIKFTGAKKLICSEAIARILYDASNKEIDFQKEYKKNYDLITPQDIYISEYLKYKGL